ncbi:MAG: magnesium transporter [Mycobacterium sp.]|nr:magnesium transporter [Mycobacterium sp.]
MPSFPALQPSLRSTAGDRPTYPGASRFMCRSRTHAVNWGVYVDGQRLPGKYTPAAALARVRELGEGFVWGGLHEPDEHQMQEVAEVFGL